MIIVTKVCLCFEISYDTLAIFFAKRINDVRTKS